MKNFGKSNKRVVLNKHIGRKNVEKKSKISSQKKTRKCYNCQEKASMILKYLEAKKR